MGPSVNVGRIEYRPILGDCFSVRTGGPLGYGIRFAEWVWSEDGEATYNHSGILKNVYGTTFEAWYTVKERHLKDHVGKQIILARFETCSHEIRKLAFSMVRARHRGQWYPVWRIPFHLIPPLAKWISWKGRFLVCSELVAEYLYLCNLRHFQYPGTNPDTLADEWRRWDGWTTLEGQLDYAGGKGFFINDCQMRHN